MDLRGKEQCLRLLQQCRQGTCMVPLETERVCYILEAELRELEIDGLWQIEGGVRNESQVSGLSTW